MSGWPDWELLVEHCRLAQVIADRTAVADIECEAELEHLPGDPHKWWDTRPMLDPDRAPQEFIDMHADSLAYARLAGLIAHHPDHAHLVRILRNPERDTVHGYV